MKNHNIQPSLGEIMIAPNLFRGSSRLRWRPHHPEGFPEEKRVCVHQKSQLEISYPKFYRITTWIKSPTELWIAKEVKLYNLKKALGLIHISFQPTSWCLAWSLNSLRFHTAEDLPSTWDYCHISCPILPKWLFPKQWPTIHNKYSSFSPLQKKGIQFRFVWSCRNLYEKTGIIWPYAYFWLASQPAWVTRHNWACLNGNFCTQNGKSLMVSPSS